MTVNDVYRKIKEMSAETWNPRPIININAISERMGARRESLMPMLSYLEEIKLIKFNERGKTSIKLTLLGSVVTRNKD